MYGCILQHMVEVDGMQGAAQRRRWALMEAGRGVAGRGVARGVDRGAGVPKSCAISRRARAGGAAGSWWVAARRMGAVRGGSQRVDQWWWMEGVGVSGQGGGGGGRVGAGVVAVRAAGECGGGGGRLEHGMGAVRGGKNVRQGRRPARGAAGARPVMARMECGAVGAQRVQRWDELQGGVHERGWECVGA